MSPSLSDRFPGTPRKVPKRIYHYTTQAGLIGILRSKSLWATSIEFLNDSKEFHYTLDLFKQALDSRIKTANKISRLPAAHNHVLRSLRVLRRATLGVRAGKTHVACFSEDPDALSLWRGYCPGAAGFSIGFAPSQLDMSNYAIRLERCTYDHRKHVELIEDLVNSHVSAIIREESAETFQTRVRDTFFHIDLLACSLKHPSFKDEREWRIVIQEFSNTRQELSVRPGKFTPIPYVELKVVKPNKKLNVEIIVGPNPQTELASEAVRTLLARFDCQGTVRKSEIPYREL
jgi:Protein of unknown function (DUF2971)